MLQRMSEVLLRLTPCPDPGAPACLGSQRLDRMVGRGGGTFK